MTAARALLLTLAVGTAAAIGIAWDYDDIPEATIERIQDAASYFRAKGVSDETMASRLAQHLGISEAKAIEIVRRSYGRDTRDDRSLRSVMVHMWTSNANLVAAQDAVAQAWCWPLRDLPEHATCLAEQAGWFAGSLCNAQGNVRARWASLVVRPAEGRRLNAAAGAGTYDGAAMTRTEFIAAAAAQGFHICQPAP